MHCFPILYKKIRGQLLHIIFPVKVLGFEGVSAIFWLSEINYIISYRRCQLLWFIKVEFETGTCGGTRHQSNSATSKQICYESKLTFITNVLMESHKW